MPLLAQAHPQADAREAGADDRDAVVLGGHPSEARASRPSIGAGTNGRIR